MILQWKECDIATAPPQAFLNNKQRSAVAAVPEGLKLTKTLT